MFDLTGRVAILTGGAGLLGRQYTRTLLDAGAKVVVVDVQPDQAAVAAQTAMSEVGGEAIGYGLDMRRKADVETMVASIRKQFGSASTS